MGQKVYGAGIAMAYTTRYYWRLTDKLLLHCDYPVRDVKTRVQKGRSSMTFVAGGHRRRVGTLRVVPLDPAPLPPGIKARAKRGKGWRDLNLDRSRDGHLVSELRGGGMYSVSWPT